MLRVIRTDFYRLFRSKEFYVYPVVMTVLILISMIFTADKGSTVIEGEDGITIEVTTTENGYIEDDNGSISSESEVHISIEDILSSLFNENLLFLGIIFVIFTTSETRNGFLKNSVACVKDRSYMVYSKVIIGITIMVSYVVEYAIITIVFKSLQAAVSGKKMVWVGIPEGYGTTYTGYICLCILINIAIILILELIHELTRNRAFGIVMAFCFASTLIEQLIHGIVDFLQSAFGILKDFDIGRYLLIEGVSNGYKSPDYHPESVLTMCLIYITICTILSITVIKNKDVR